MGNTSRQALEAKSPRLRRNRLFPPPSSAVTVLLGFCLPRSFSLAALHVQAGKGRFQKQTQRRILSNGTGYVGKEGEAFPLATAIHDGLNFGNQDTSIPSALAHEPEFGMEPTLPSVSSRDSRQGRGPISCVAGPSSTVRSMPRWTSMVRQSGL